MELLSHHQCFGGSQAQYQHQSDSTDSLMRFSIFTPKSDKPLPVVFWLSGLTATDENFSMKAGAQRFATELGLNLVMLDTSPRGETIADVSEYDLGQGASFYVNATQAPWQPHFMMYDYVVDELPALVEKHFNVSDERAISGHSMGGHGALMIGLKNPKKYKSISAFSPIANPMQCPWGKKAFEAYLGSESSHWRQYDSCELLKNESETLPIKLTVGLADEFLTEQLLIDNFIEIAQQKSIRIETQKVADYDHSYYFIASFIESHLRFHKQFF